MSVLSISTLLVNSILIIPFLQFFIPMIYCKEIENSYPDDVTCFKGGHIVHFCFAIVSSLNIICFGMMNAVYNYDIRFSTNNFKSRIDTTFDISQMISKILYAICFESIAYASDNDSLLISTLLFLNNFALFLVIKIKNPFYYAIAQKTYALLFGTLLWTSIILLGDNLLRFFKIYGFDANFEVWSVGFIVILVYEYLVRIDYSELLIIDINKITSSQRALRKLFFFIELIEKRHVRKDYEILLKGYVFRHLENCVHTNCHLKDYQEHYLSTGFENLNHEENNKYALNQTDNYNNSDTTSSDQKRINILSAKSLIKEEERRILFNFCIQLFEEVIKKFPHNKNIKFAYCVFLLEKVKINNLTKFHIAELSLQENLTYSEEFSKFRLYRIMKEEMMNIDEDNANLDIATAICFDQNSKEFQKNLEKIGIMYMNFWIMFVQDDMNINKIKTLGYKINDLISKTYMLWTNLQSLNPNDKESLRLCGLFMIEILNDKERGKQLLQKSKEIITSNVSSIRFFKNDINYYTSDGNPCILATTSETYGAIIAQITVSAIRLFGYSKQELVGKNVSILLPPIFREKHFDILKNYIKNKGTSKVNDKKRIVSFAMAKSNFIFPVTLYMDFLPSLNTDPCIAVVFKKEKRYNYVGYMITNLELDVVNITSECIKLFNLSEKLLNILKNWYKIPKDERISLKNMILELSSYSFPDYSYVGKKYLKDYQSDKMSECHLMNTDLIRDYIKHTNSSKYISKFIFNYIYNNRSKEFYWQI